MIEIRKLDRDAYAGKSFTLRYTTGAYYDISETGCGFGVVRKAFDAPKEMVIDDVFFGPWLDAPEGFGAFERERLLGFAEGFLETWNNRYRIANICVFDPADRGAGVGTLLMNAALTEAGACGARMAVVETQSCNEKAIAFYRKCGFEIIGFDLFSYSNQDPENHEIRIEMGRKLK